MPITPAQQIDFNTVEEQNTYFSNNVVFSSSNCSYQPRTSNIKFKGYVDELESANYGFYDNTYNGVTKRFYFWIVARNFIAKKTSEIVIQIDVFQTWLFVAKFKPCLVEREHVVDDTLGTHTLPEDFELGEYITAQKQPIIDLTGQPCFFIGVTDIDATNGIEGGLYGKTYEGYSIVYFDIYHTSELTTFINDLALAGKADAIAFIFMFPMDFLAHSNLTFSNFVNGERVTGVPQVAYIDYTFNILKNGFSFNNRTYTPYNNKMYTYPFNFVTVKNASGSNVVLKIENFSNTDTITFKCESVVTKTPIITLTPLNYAGKLYAIDDSISLQDYGLCSWNNDNYSNWFAQHVNTIVAQSENARSSLRTNQSVASNNYYNSLGNRNTQAIKGGVNTALSTATQAGSLNFVGATATALGGATNTYLDYQQNTKNTQNTLDNSNLLMQNSYNNEIRSLLASVKDASVQPNTCKGDTSSNGLDVARGTATFFIEQTIIKPEYAKIIDMYFQMFGYQVNEVKRPSFNTRVRWNYLKTVNCCCYGEVPHADLDELNNIFNSGLTVWHNENYMYNYDISNEVVNNG